jgi:hypothetical protein
MPGFQTIPGMLSSANDDNTPVQEAWRDHACAEEELKIKLSRKPFYILIV